MSYLESIEIFRVENVNVELHRIKYQRGQRIMTFPSLRAR